MTPVGTKSAPAISIIAAMWIAVTAIAVTGAVRWYAHPFPGVLVTSDGNVSSIGMPPWGGIGQGLRFPDQVESIGEGALVASRGEFRSANWDRGVDRALPTLPDAAHLRVAAGATQRGSG